MTLSFMKMFLICYSIIVTKMKKLQMFNAFHFPAIFPQTFLFSQKTQQRIISLLKNNFHTLKQIKQLSRIKKSTEVQICV